jgi:hypothetical protein
MSEDETAGTAGDIHSTIGSLTGELGVATQTSTEAIESCKSDIESLADQIHRLLPTVPKDSPYMDKFCQVESELLDASTAIGTGLNDHTPIGDQNDNYSEAAQHLSNAYGVLD